TVNTTLYTPEELVKDVLVGMDCALIENITSQGYPAGMGYFHANNSDFPLKEGVVLRCGPVLNTAGPFTTGGGDGVASGMGDADLQAISIANGQPNSINDVTFLQFDFTPINDQMSFNFVFASNEYASGFQCTFADVFAFILTDLTTGVETNIALVPDTTIPVSVTTIRNGLHGCAAVNEEYYDQSNVAGDPINMRGNTVSLVAQSPVIPCRQYRIKLAIGDYLDTTLDSAVFLEAGSFDIGSLDLGNDYLIEQGTALCPTDTILLQSGLDEIDGVCDIVYNYQWYYNGEPIPGATDPTYEVPEGQEGLYELYTNIQILGEDVDVECDLNPGSVIVQFYPELPAGEPEDLESCNGIFDLTDVYDDIYGSELTEGDVEITFHLNMEDLENWMNLEWVDPYPSLNAYTAL